MSCLLVRTYWQQRLNSSVYRPVHRVSQNIWMGVRYSPLRPPCVGMRLCVFFSPVTIVSQRMGVLPSFGLYRLAQAVLEVGWPTLNPLQFAISQARGLLPPLGSLSMSLKTSRIGWLCKNGLVYGAPITYWSAMIIKRSLRSPPSIEQKTRLSGAMGRQLRFSKAKPAGLQIKVMSPRKTIITLMRFLVATLRPSQPSLLPWAIS